MLDLERLQTLITENHLPAEIVDIGRTWVCVRLTDEQTELTETRAMGISDFVDMILHWREHGCHQRHCWGMTAAESHTHEPPSRETAARPPALPPSEVAPRK